MSPLTKQLEKIARVFLPMLLLVVSCSNPETDLRKYGVVFKNVVRSDDGIFRGYHLGDSQETIQVSETEDPIEVDDGYLYYEYQIDTIGVYNISYSFDEKGLKEIQSEIYIDNAVEVESILKNFKMYFDNHYGDSESQMGFTVWSVKSDKYAEIKVSLSDESVDFTTENAPGKISIWIYPTVH